jgi:protein TonB
MRQILLDLKEDRSSREPTEPLRLPSSVKKDVFLSALLEMPTTKRPHRSPLEWAGAMGIHLVIITALLMVSLYSTDKIGLKEYEETPLVAPAPSLPPATPGVKTAAPHIAHTRPRFSYTAPKFTATKSIAKKSAQIGTEAATGPDLGGVTNGNAAGIAGGEIGGLAGGVLGGTGTAVPPPPPPQPRPTKRIVRVGSNLKPPRQVFSVNPEYPPLARQAHIAGTVLVDAVIDEQGNVIQARAVSGAPLLVPAALKAVLQWKYEPTSLNGQRVSIELEVEVHFRT